MVKAQPGFLLLEVMTASGLVLAGVAGALACYLTGVQLMLRHAAREEAMSLAQKALVEYQEGSEQVEFNDREYRVVRRCQSLPTPWQGQQVEIAVYYQEEPEPLVNVVTYE